MLLDADDEVMKTEAMGHNLCTPSAVPLKRQTERLGTDASQHCQSVSQFYVVLVTCCYHAITAHRHWALTKPDTYVTSPSYVCSLQ